MQTAWFIVALAALSAGELAVVAPDSLANLETARRAQASFERVRARQVPWGSWAGSGPCDERVGRFCLTHSAARDDDSTPPYRPPPEPPSLIEARARLDSTLAAIAIQQPGDAWVAGQRVAYRGEVGDWPGALAAAQGCTSPEPGWCELLRGFALHGAGRVEAAEAAFRRGVSAFSAERQADWWALDVLLEQEVARELRRMRGEQREVFQQALWALADPLYLEGGNALLTEHFSRHTLARIRADSRNPHGMRWGDDLTEILLRLGPEVGWERVRDAGMQPGSAGVSARFAWDPRGVFPTMEALTSPATAGLSSFAVANSRTRSRHAPPRALRLRDLPARFTRFQRGNALLVVAAWATPDLPLWDSVPELRISEAALFFQPIGSLDARASASEISLVPGERTRADLVPEARGVGRIRISSAPGLLSLELVDDGGPRGWRARQGTGVALQGMSDILLLDADSILEREARLRDASPAPLGGVGGPEGIGRLEDVWGAALPSSRLVSNAVALAWEVYELAATPVPLDFRVFLEPGEASWFRRAGQALRILSPVSPLRLAWTEVPLDREIAAGGLLFRRVLLDLSGLQSGPWSLRVEVESPDGRVRTSTTDLWILSEGIR